MIAGAAAFHHPDDRLDRVFAALADPTRRDIVARLAVEDATVGQLARPYVVSVQAVSKHVRVLEDAGLVSRRGATSRSPRHLEAEVFDLATAWIERYRRAAESRYRRLDVVLAESDDAVAAPHADAAARDRAPADPAAPGKPRGVRRRPIPQSPSEGAAS